MSEGGTSELVCEGGNSWVRVRLVCEGRLRVELVSEGRVSWEGTGGQEGQEVREWN